MKFWTTKPPISLETERSLMAMYEGVRSFLLKETDAGEWGEWKPLAQSWVQEFDYHYDKAKTALRWGDKAEASKCFRAMGALLAKAAECL